MHFNLFSFTSNLFIVVEVIVLTNEWFLSSTLTELLSTIQIFILWPAW